MISKISRKLLGYLPSKTNEKSIAFSSNSSGAYKNNKALSIARAVLGTSHVHIEYCVVMQRSVGYWGSSYPICGNCFMNFSHRIGSKKRIPVSKKNPHFDKLGSRVNFSSTCFFSLVTKLTKMAACLQTLFFGFFHLSLVFRHCRKLQNVRQR